MLGQYQPCEGMIETQVPVCSSTLHDHTAIVMTQEHVAVVYPTLDNLINKKNNSQVV